MTLTEVSVDKIIGRISPTKIKHFVTPFKFTEFGSRSIGTFGMIFTKPHLDEKFLKRWFSKNI